MSEKKKLYFDEVDTRVDFSELEKQLLNEWKNSGLVEKYLVRNKDSEKYFSFIDGPITANNPMGVHHGWGRTYKDVWQRYKNMRGYRQRFQNGFDCQGLWVEVEVEKELGFKNKKEIEEYGIDNFVEKCKERVYKYSAMQTEQSKRLGYFMDWENSYFTLSDENNYMIWHFLKTCFDRDLIYKGRDSVPWCPRCGTAISQHEMLTEDYKDVTHESIFFELPIEGEGKEYLLVWTTTPWTIPANVAVAVDSEMNYVLVEGAEEGKKFWLAEARVEAVFGKEHGKILKTVKGKELVGKKYAGPFDDLPAVAEVKKKHENFHTVVATNERIMPISTEEGTGMVHTATGAGTEDFALGLELGLPVLPVIEEDANYMEGFGFLTGKNAKKNPRLILDYLEEETKKKDIDWVFKIEKYKHRYPACWRCKEELVWRVVNEWYIKIDPVREDMKEVTKKARWIPKFGLARELDWLSNMHDWLISKKRYWGLALPIWECSKCGNFTVIGGKEELKERAVSGWDEFEGNSPHRPWVDKIKIKCECGEEMQRITDVGNPWLDAGIVPYSTISKDNKSEPLYKSDRAEWEKWFPADFITESFPGQFKNWFYSMIAMSAVLTKREPFKTVLGFGTLLGEDGRAMHKSWGNSIEFNEGADKIGADVMRFMYARQNPSENLLFGYGKADETRRRFHLKLWNVYNFFVTYANIDNFRPSGGFLMSDKKLSVLDQWIVSRLGQLMKVMTAGLDDFNVYRPAEALEEFVDDLSNWYVRRSRERVGPWVESGGDKEAFYETTYYILTNLMKLMAPLMPFYSETIYRNLTKEESVHLTDWPSFEGEIDQKLIEEMVNLRLAVESAHSVRKEKNIPVRVPLLGLVSTVPFEKVRDELKYLVLDEVNVKNWEMRKGEVLASEFDMAESPELIEEAKARELIRRIQMERREMGANLADTVSVVSEWVPEDVSLLKKAGVSKISEGVFRVKVDD